MKPPPFSLRPSHSPSKVVQAIKANTSRLMLKRFSELEVELGQRSLWSRGYYARSVGSVTADVIRQYVARQRQHHGHDSLLLASYEHPDPREFFDFRPFSHCVAEYNCHLVFCPAGHAPAIDETHADPLVAYVLDVATARKFDVISLAVLEDHVHLFAALRPDRTPESLALDVLNDTSRWMASRDPGAMKRCNGPGLWAPSAYVGTAGAVTTDVMRGHIRGLRELG